jgi:ribonuclease Z
VKLTILGTGTPQPNPQRSGPAQVVSIGDDNILIDAGAGTMHRFVQAGYTTAPLKAIALTHLHSDHVTGILDVLWAGWIQRRWRVPPTIYGPPGTQHFIDHLIQAMSYDIKVRTGETLRAENLIPFVVEIEDGWKVRGKDWQLSAFRVDHFPVDEAFGFRIDYGSSSVVISGDTCYSGEPDRHAKDTDLLAREVTSPAACGHRRRRPDDESAGLSNQQLPYRLEEVSRRLAQRPAPGPQPSFAPAATPPTSRQTSGPITAAS